LDYVTKESCEICARRSSVQLEAMIESVHRFYLAGTKYWKYVSIFLRFCLKIHEVIVSNIVFVKFLAMQGFFHHTMGVVIRRKNVKRNVTLCNVHGVNTTVNYRNMAGLRTASMTGNDWYPVCWQCFWHITSSNTNSPCCLLVEIYQPYLLQQCLDQGARAICHTEISREKHRFQTCMYVMYVKLHLMTLALSTAIVDFHKGRH
jgi:hypothetical protein